MVEKIIIIALSVWAIQCTTWEGMIFGSLPKFAEKTKCPEWIIKVLFKCVVCGTPYYGSLVYALIWRNSVSEWLITVLCAMGLNAILVSYLPLE